VGDHQSSDNSFDRGWKLIYSFSMYEIVLTTDYVRSTGDPGHYLRRIADSGFSAVHWCHQWLGEHRYRTAEVRKIRGLLERYGLRMLDLHAAVGFFSDCSSGNELRRRAGVEQIRNRIRMAAELGGDAVVLHLPEGRVKPEGRYVGPVRRSLDELEKESVGSGVRIALENLPTPGHMEVVLELLDEYPPEFFGLCYDSGHGNMAGNGVELLKRMAGGMAKRMEAGQPNRIAALHLHDNDGRKDLHLPPFRGTVDWQRLMQVLRMAGYEKPLCLESSIRHSGHSSEEAFLEECLEAGQRLNQMIQEKDEPEGRSRADGK
jgi:sugar phosphate isomerase/epimerase